MKLPIQISIPQPCHEDWNKMTPTEQGRFCNTCQKCVMDFTGFTDKQLYDFFDIHKGQKICGRFESIQLNRQIQVQPQPNSLLYKYFIALSLTIVLVQAPNQQIKAKAPFVHKIITTNNNSTAYSTENKDSITISGYVYDNNKKPIKKATAQLHYANNIFEAITNAKGYYHLSIPANCRVELLMLVVTAINFETETIYYTQENLTDIKTTVLNQAIIEERTYTGLAEIILQDPKVPLIDPSNPSNRTFTSDEIEKMPR